MTISMFFPDDNGYHRQQRAKIKKIQKDMEQQKQKQVDVSPKHDTPTTRTYRKVGDNYYEVHKTETGGTMIDLSKPITNLKEPTAKEFQEVMFGL